MSSLVRELSELKKQKAFFIAIDSDGCVFDTMEVKHKECFCPVTIRHFGLQAISKYAREAWEFVNLYSRLRGTNRFPALVAVMDLLRNRTEVRHRAVKIPTLDSLREWIRAESKLGNPALRRAANKTPELVDVLIWSQAVNKAISDMVHGVPPFPYVRDSLQKATRSADLIVASSTPNEALQREWTEQGIAEYVRVIAGQEIGNKTQQLSRATRGQYAADSMLMIGDAFGDYNAARSVGACFYPILPGHEEASWEKFFTEALDRFTDGKYRGAYEDALIAELYAVLPEYPTWVTP